MLPLQAFQNVAPLVLETTYLYQNLMKRLVFFPWFSFNGLILLLLLVTTEYVSYYPLWTSGRGAGQPFILKGTVFYPEETIMYPLQTIIIQRWREVTDIYF